MLKEVQMPPSVALGVVHLASGRSALRARKPSTLREVNPKIKTTPRNIELDIHDLPRLLEAKGSLKQVEIVHAGLLFIADQKPGRLATGPDATHSEQRGALLSRFSSRTGGRARGREYS